MVTVLVKEVKGHHTEFMLHFLWIYFVVSVASEFCTSTGPEFIATTTDFRTMSLSDLNEASFFKLV